jgi:hypothetical protein
MTGAVRPWAGKWAKLAEESQKDKTGVNPAMLTFITWELGHQELYAKIVQMFVGECSINGNGHLTTPKGLCLEDYDHIGPLDLLGMPNLFDIHLGKQERQVLMCVQRKSAMREGPSSNRSSICFMISLRPCWMGTIASSELPL